MNKSNFFFGIGGVLVGLVIGFLVANNINRNAFTQSQTNVHNQQFPNQTSGDMRQSQQMPQIAETLEKAEKEPNNFEAQLKAAELYVQIQKFDKAAEFYEKANKIKPDDYETIVLVGNAYFDAQNYETAEKWYLQALEKKPDDTNVRTDLGITFLERQNPNFERAIKEFQNSLTKNPKHEPSLYNLGIAYFKMGNKEELQKTIQKFEQANPNSQLLARLKQNTIQK